MTGSAVVPQRALWVTPVADMAGVARHILDAASVGVPGYRMTVLCPPGPLAAKLREIGVCTIVGEFGPDFGYVSSQRTLRRAIRQLRPTVVHSHLAYADVVCAGVLLSCPGTALISTEHGIAPGRLYQKGNLGAVIKQAMHRLRLRRCNHVIAVSQATADLVTSKWKPKCPITVVRNGVDAAVPVPNTGDNPRRVRRLGEGIRILSLSRLAPEKRVDALIRAVPSIRQRDPRVQLTIAGIGSEEAGLKALTKRLGLNNCVKFVGFQDPAVLVPEHDVIAQLSTWENLSYTLLDAAAAGIPAIATSVGGNAEILPSDQLIDDVQPETIIKALEKIGPAGAPEQTVYAMVCGIAEVYDAVIAPGLQGQRRSWRKRTLQKSDRNIGNPAGGA